MARERKSSRREHAILGARAAAAVGVELGSHERVDPCGSSWLIRDVTGFEPCPWAFDLANFTPVAPGDRVLDLGCGGGVLLMAMAQVHGDMGFALGLDRQRRAVHQAQRNARLGGHEHMAFVVGDVRHLPMGPGFDLVVSNPPFYPAGWGRVSSRQSVADSTHALHGDIDAFTKGARAVLAPSGRVVILFDAMRSRDLILAVDAAGLTMEHLEFLEDDRGQFSRVLALAGLRDTVGLKTSRRFF